MKNIQKFGIVGTLLIGLLTACPSPAPAPSPAGTYVDNAVVVAGLCGAPANSPNLVLTFTIAAPTAMGGVIVSSTTSGSNTVDSYQGTYSSPTVNATSTSGGSTSTLTGSINFSTNRFAGTVTGQCATGTPATVTFNALKQ